MRLDTMAWARETRRKEAKKRQPRMKQNDNSRSTRPRQQCKAHNQRITRPSREHRTDHNRTGNYEVGRPMPLSGFSFVPTSLAHTIPVFGGLVVQGLGQGGAIHPRGKRAATAPVLPVRVPRIASRVGTRQRSGTVFAWWQHLRVKIQDAPIKC